MAQHLSIDMLLSLKDKISGPLKHVTDQIKGLDDITDKTARRFTRLQNETAKFAKTAKQLDGIGKPLMALGVAGAAGIGLTVKSFADLEEAQNALKVNLMDTAGKVTPEYGKLLKLSERLGVELPGSTKDMLEMFTAMQEQGIGANRILGGMGEAAAKFAVIMKVPYAEAAVSVAQLSISLGIADKDSITFMDTLQRLKSTAGVNMNDLTDTIRYSGAALKALRVQGIEAGRDVASAIGLMKQSSIEGSVAGTSMSMALTRMAEISSRLDRGIVKKLVGPILDRKGIKLDFFDNAGNFKGIRGMIMELEKLKKVNPQEQLIVLTKLFGQEAAKPLSVFINSGVSGFDQMNRKMAAQADMHKKIRTIMGGTKMQWDTMTGTASNLTASIGGQFARLVNLPAVLTSVNNLFGQMNDWVLANPKTAGILGGIVVGLTAVSLVGGGILLTLAGIGSVIGPALTGMAALTRIVGMLNVGTKIATAVQWAFNLALSANPVGLVVVGVAALAASAYLIYRNWGPLSKFFTGIWKSVVSITGKMREAGANLINQLWQGIKSMAMKPIEAIKAIAQKIRNHLPFSPAKEGPLRDINRIRLVETIAETIKPGPMARAMRNATSSTLRAASTGSRAALAGSGGGISVHYAPVLHVGGGSGVRNEVNQALAISQHELEKMLKRVLDQQQRRGF